MTHGLFDQTGDAEPWDYDAAVAKIRARMGSADDGFELGIIQIAESYAKALLHTYPHDQLPQVAEHTMFVGATMAFLVATLANEGLPPGSGTVVCNTLMAASVELLDRLEMEADDGGL